MPVTNPIRLPLQRFAVRAAVHLLHEMACLLMGGVGPWRNGLRLTGVDQKRAIPHRKHVRIPCGLQGWRHDQLIASACLKAVKIP